MTARQRAALESLAACHPRPRSSAQLAAELRVEPFAQWRALPALNIVCAGTVLIKGVELLHTPLK